MSGIVGNRGNTIRWHNDNLVLQCTGPAKASNLLPGTKLKIFYVGDVVLAYRRNADDEGIAKEVAAVAEESGFIGEVDRKAKMMNSNGRENNCAMLPLSVLETRKYGETDCEQLDVGDSPTVYATPGKMVIFPRGSQHVDKVINERALSDEELDNLR